MSTVIIPFGYISQTFNDPVAFATGYRDINSEVYDSAFRIMFSSGGGNDSSYKEGMPRNGQQMLIHVRYSQLTYDEYEAHFLNLVANDAQHPGKARAFFRSNFLGPYHAKYVYMGSDPPSNGQLPNHHKIYGYTQDDLNNEINIIALYKSYYTDPLNGPLNDFKKYEDHYIEVTAPFHKEEIEVVNNAPKVNQVNVEPSYNFYNEVYETKTNEMDLDDDPKQLPNMYLMLQNEYDYEEDSELNNLVTVHQSLHEYTGKFLNDKGEKDENQLKPSYFKDWSYAHEVYLSENLPGYLDKTQRNQNLIFLMNKASYLKDYNKYSNKFPMANTISFSAMKTNPIADTLQKTKIDFGLLRTLEIVNNSPENFYDVLPAFQNKTVIKGMQTLDRDDNGDIIENTTSVNSRQIRCIDMETWLNEYFKSGDDYLSALSTNPNQFVRVLGENISKAGLAYNGPKFLQKLISIIFNQKLNNLAGQYLRTHQEILRGKPAHHEIIAYRVAKHKVNNGEIVAVPEQNFYIANADQLDEIIYHDTQVTYGSEYKYLIYAYALVIGNRYTYSTSDLYGGSGAAYDRNLRIHAAPAGSKSNGCTIRAGAFSHPSYKLFELPYYGFEEGEKSTGYMFDDPPVPPDVNIGGYRGINNKINITLSNTYGEYIEKPIVLEDIDNTTFNNAIKYQSLSKKQVTAGKVRFKTDDMSNRFEVFRIGPDLITGKTPRPTGFYDFQGRKIRLIGNPTSDSVSFDDTIQPNTKYYYAFRSIDKHNNISNPSAVYEVEIINNPSSNLGYVTMRTYDFKPLFEPVMKKSMRRYMHIEPRLEQKQIDLDLDDPSVDINSVIDNPPMPGLLEDPLFSDSGSENNDRLKKFKIRLTSKRSGKKIDVNIKFIRSYNKLKKPQVF